MRIREKLAWIMLAALGLFVAAAITGVATSGPLDPPGPVGSTMKTLEEIPGSWSRALSTDGADPCDTERFRCVLEDEAVLDVETGLVWQRTVPQLNVIYATAVANCQAATTGDRRGWRLPSLEELQSLMDMSQPDRTPPNNPFTLAPWSVGVWTSTPSSLSSAYVHAMNIENNLVFNSVKNQSRRAWCVRAPEGADEALALEPPRPSWHQQLTTSQGHADPCASERFLCVLSDQAVLDRETGLVWQRVALDSGTWSQAFFHCQALNILGGRHGWRVPSLDEIMTLMLAGGLPSGHPFTIATDTLYWTSTDRRMADGSTLETEAYVVAFSPFNVTTADKSLTRHHWCVRGPE